MSDSTFWAWCVGAASCLVAAAVLALWLTADATPKGRHRVAGDSIRISLDGLRAPAYHYRPAVPAHAEPNPRSTALPATISVPSLSPTRQEIEASVIERERRAALVPEAVEPGLITPPIPWIEPEFVNVVPLWEREEERRRAERRRALVAASKGLPDPGYSYEGAHIFAGAVA
ncbi:hypothetical protein ABTX81_17390 [Kitasatospora sp. NPDC097605]|uniref:hypothetical protein n=1 Tax=Kitasatospora sp. NPDC097605 TaxID=3157226 RepID=UPI00332CB820